MKALGVIAGELSRLLATSVGIVVVVFFLVRMVPGDVVDVLSIDGDYTYQQQTLMRADLGLNEGWGTQFLHWIDHARHGDLGVSARFHRPVTEMIGVALAPTLKLAGMSFAFAVVLGVGLAALAALYPGSVFGWLVNLVNIWSIALPTFSVGIAAVIVFALWLGWMPATGTLLAPAIVLGMDTAGTLVKMLHEDLSEMDHALWVRTARAKGLGRARIVFAHMLPNAATVLLAMTGIVLGGLVGGAITMEVVFGLPGIGSLTVQAMRGRDYPLIQAIILLLALGVVLANFVTDLLQRLIDPRVGRGLPR
jgi:peptide/nickel transport system permease protein